MSQMSFGSGGELVPVQVKIELDLEDAQRHANMFISTVSGAMGLLRRMTGDENLQRAIAHWQRAILVLNMLRTTAMAAYAAAPWMLPFVAIGAVGTSITLAETIGDMADVY